MIGKAIPIALLTAISSAMERYSALTAQDRSCAVRNSQARESRDIVTVHGRHMDRITEIREERAMNLVVLLIVLLLLFGGGGFYLGGPAVGGGLGGLILLVLIVMLLTGRLGSRA